MRRNRDNEENKEEEQQQERTKSIGPKALCLNSQYLSVFL